MKKVLLSLAFSMPFLFASAQSNKKIEFGINGGLSLYNLTNRQIYSENNYKAGFAAGVAVSIPIAKSFYIQPEALYQQQGSKYANLTTSISKADYEMRFGYVNFPLLAKYQLFNSNLSIYAGPQLGILTNAKYILTVSGTDINGKYETDIKKDVNTIDFSGAYGLEYYFAIGGNSKIVLNARYNTGFSHVMKSEESRDAKSKNTGFTFMVGYRF
ncbi:porin family protein [Rhizosphaericola mali]|nr:porin family protein [Rhizosphaericola mali]